MQFRVPQDHPENQIHLAALSGHTAVVGRDWRELPEILHNLALLEGCECNKEVVRLEAPVAVLPSATAQNLDGDADGSYRNAIVTMIGRNELRDFTVTDHLPNINVVSRLCGFTARKEDVLRVYRQMMIEAGVEDFVVAKREAEAEAGA